MWLNERAVIFRGRRTDNGVWEIGDLIEVAGEYYIINTRNVTPRPQSDTHQINCCCYKVDGHTVGQYIGLHDKEQRMIFEGDRVLYDGRLYEVINKGTRLSFGLENVRHPYLIDIPLFTAEGNELEIVGGDDE